MHTQTYIPGKDAPLEETVTKVHECITELGVDLVEVSHLNPIPNCWSVHLQAANCHALYTNGKGVSKLSSLASGIGEFIERLATDFFFNDYYLGDLDLATAPDTFHYFPDEVWFSTGVCSEKIEHLYHKDGPETLLSPDLLTFYNPEGELTPEMLIDNNFDSSDNRVCALPFIDVNDSSICYFPVSILNNLYVSNGMAAGNTPAECRSQALSEIIERYVKNKVIANGLSLPAVPDYELSDVPHLLNIKNALKDNDFSITIHDCSLGGQFPVICVLLVDGLTGGAYAAFGANCRFEIAIERTLTELLQGRELNQLHNFSSPVHSTDLVADQYNLESHFIDSDGLLAWTMFKDEPDFPYSPWSFEGNTEAEEAELLSRIKEAGFAIYRRDYLHCGLYSCRFIVPGMSEIYPVDDLVWNNRNRGCQLRRVLLQLPKMNDSELQATLVLLDELELDDNLPVSHVIGIIFDRETAWNNLRICELKAHIYLALKDQHNAIIQCTRLVELAELPLDRLKVFQAILTLLQLQENEGSTQHYASSLQRFFSDDDLTSAKDVINSRVRFYGLTFKQSWQELSSEHATLLELYKKLKRVKAGNVD